MKAQTLWKKESTQLLGQSDLEKFLKQCTGLSDGARAQSESGC
jgi:hypothetical protein